MSQFQAKLHGVIIDCVNTYGTSIDDEAIAEMLRNIADRIDPDT